MSDFNFRLTPTDSSITISFGIHYLSLIWLILLEEKIRMLYKLVKQKVWKG
jgi:hypothetical protein